ncbi:peptidoglycan DD-metalloendopeptidase family protein [Shewanella sp. 202IG2-18]|uniref:murein hydrolase activator EnvC family protein n=1 Tax=Parashewanella hymeniacidonis TaxID=2807618 RepID=UPI001961AE41|nr:peptidoglycan DD-metalloendopeptidase family protein [Parashewanella hymeniacidonis]MBM7074099.1 peptidoglycan DD-metalloendopeptidase family protein [Parashewanella hymeniacidonis]
MQGWYRPFIIAFLLLGFNSLSFFSYAETIANRQSQLKDIQAQIDAQHSELKSTRNQRNQLQNLLKKDDVAIGKVARALNNSQNKQQELNRSLVKLEKKHANLEKFKVSQQKTLAKQLESAYLSGNHDYAKMLLNQQDPASIERMLTYYQYLNKARINAIETLKTTITDLNDTQTQLEAQKTELAKVIETQKQQANALGKEKSQRKQTLAQLQRTLSSNSEQLEQLQIEEASLKQIIEEAIREAKAQNSLSGLAKHRGKLKWPTRGRLAHRFGASRSGQLKWKGVLMSAPEGRTIRSIAAGKVIYADWLKGFGMVIVIDHGKGYMSLYGHAQALLHSTGDTIKQGESIALVGQSGGQAEPGLYFEIRYKGKAVNPAIYCRS